MGKDQKLLKAKQGDSFPIDFLEDNNLYNPQHNEILFVWVFVTPIVYNKNEVTNRNAENISYISNNTDCIKTT